MENTFDTRYKSPNMRDRHQRVMGEDNPMEKAAEDAAPEKQMSTASVFASPEAFGDTPPKEGMKGSYEVKAVDPDSGEAELMLMPEGGMEEKTAPEPMPEEEPQPEMS